MEKIKSQRPGAMLEWCGGSLEALKGVQLLENLGFVWIFFNGWRSIFLHENEQESIDVAPGGRTMFVE